MLKKITLLAMAVGALIAFAVPAMASAADEWTYNKGTVGVGSTVQEEYEGRLFFTTPKPPFPLHGTFSCQVTTVVQVSGTANGTGSAQITSFAPTTSTCEGEGLFAGSSLIADTSNPPWPVTIGGATLGIGGPITITNTYEGGLVEESTLTFNSVTATPTLNGENGITSISISGTATNGAIASGSVAAETGAKLGLDF